MPASAIVSLNAIVTSWIGYLVQALPWLLLGIMISSSLLILFQSWRGGWRGVWRGAVVGIVLALLLPLAGYGSIPVARRLLLMRLSPAVAVAFLVASPHLNWLTLWATHRAFRSQPEIFWWQIGTTVVIALFLGVLFGINRRKRPLGKSQSNSDVVPQYSILLRSGSRIRFPQQKDTPIQLSPTRLWIDNTIGEFCELCWWLVVGSGVAAVVNFWFSIQSILGLTSHPVRIAALELFGCSLSINSLAATEFAAGLVTYATDGGVLAFLLANGSVNLIFVTLMLVTFRLKWVIYYLILVFQSIFLAALLVDADWWYRWIS